MLDKPITILKGIGPQKFNIIKDELNLTIIEDLLYFKPRKYIDRSKLLKINQVKNGEIVSILGTITKVTIITSKRKFLKIELSDETDSINLIFFGGIRFFKKVFQPGEKIFVSGKVDFFKNKQIVHPDFDFFDDDNINTSRIVPIYPSTEKLKENNITTRLLRKLIKNALEISLDFIKENISEEILKKYNYKGLRESLINIHFPKTIVDAENARIRLAFNELFYVQYYLQVIKKYDRSIKKINIKNSIDYSLLDKFIEELPFQLTGDQKNVIEEIKSDLLKDFPMNRMLQGDVGSGKTLVAIAASIITYLQGFQVIIMAPTEVLAKQHYNTFKSLLPVNITIEILTGSQHIQEKQNIKEELNSGNIDIIIGTHALIQKDTFFNKPGLVIIDEQHRFGVKQRALLREKTNNSSILVMSATPIPRTLTLTLYGDLDISYLKDKPLNRIPIETKIFPESRLPGIYNSIRKYLSQGRQCYYVLPLIEESEKIDLRSAEEIHDKLKNSIFKDWDIGLLHGKLKSDEKEKIMEDFNDNKINLLVTTTVIEVGVDVPNANIMIIHHPERFGLSQLHQLRGRIGRGEHKSFCILVHPENISNESLTRLKVIEEISDGFLISEEDLKIRGAGELIGSKQHGFNSEFDFANLNSDIDILLSAKQEAEQIVNNLSNIDEHINYIKSTGNLNKNIKGMRLNKILSILS